MSAFVGNKFSVFAANSFASSFASESIYLYYGKVTKWDVETSPPTSNDDVRGHNKIWDNMVGAMRVGRNQVSLGIKRNDWNTGVIYEKYHHANTAKEDFYVLAGSTNRDVYKCIDNNGRNYSTAKPTHRNYGLIKEKDGYVWKHMYNILDTQFTQFATKTYIPVTVSPTIPYHSSFGGISHIPISANSNIGVGAFYRGEGFVNSSYGTPFVNASIATSLPSSTATNEIQLIANSGFATMDEYYTGSMFFVTSGKGAGTYRRIVQSKAGLPLYTNDRTTNLVLSSAVSNFSNGDNFIIGPQVRIKDLQGYGFLGIGNTNRYGNVTSINVVLTGRSYANSDAYLEVVGNYNATVNNIASPTGTSQTANAELIISPAGGHGSNPLTELNAKYVIVSPETSVVKDHETGYFAGYGNDIRQVGLIRNPIDSYRGMIAQNQSYDTKTTVYFEHPTDIKFKPDQVLYNTINEGTETVRAIVYSVCGSSTQQYISLTGVQGRLPKGDILYNRLGDSAKISDVNITNHSYPLNSLTTSPSSAVLESNLTKYTGEILYHENISPITRRLDQKENFKFIFEF